MIGFLVKRTLGAVASLVGVTLLVTLFLSVIPGDPIEILLGEQAGVVDRQAMRRALGLDQPFHLRTWSFVRDLASGDLRTSLPPFQERVWPKVREKAPRTFALAVVSMTLAIAIALPLGVATARRRGSLLDHGATLFTLLGVSVPRSWLGPVLILVFAIHLDWLPALGDQSLAAMVLPATTMGLAMSAMLTRMTRASFLDVAKEDFVTTARAKGLDESAVAWRHTLRNALIPVVTIIGLQFGGLLAGAIVTEKVFNWPGLGTLLLTAIEKRDYNTVRATVLLFTFTYVLVNLLTDLAYAAVDPRVRVGARSAR